jgi:hypothetical protein
MYTGVTIASRRRLAFDHRFLSEGRLPERTKVSDPFGYASAAMAWDFRLLPGETRDIEIAPPLSGAAAPLSREGGSAGGRGDGGEGLWRAELDRFDLRIPAAEPLVRALKSTLADILINQDGPAIQPGSRSYELRIIRTLLRLGWRDRAHELLDFFMNDRRPAAWNHWAEVVWREPRIPKFIGDMPHTWVGSEFIHSILDLLAYVREPDGALVLGAGLKPEWNEVTVKGLRTEYGPLEYSVTPEGNGVRYRIAAGLKMPPGGIVVHWQDEEVVVRELPAEVVVGR